MGANSSIEWTNATWNPIRGCSRVSEGCRNCYAERVAARFSGPGMPYEGLAVLKTGPTQNPCPQTITTAKWTGEVRFIEEHLADPLRWRKPRRIFVNSMSDLFHEKVKDSWIDRIFAVMALCPQHAFQVLTKRPERMREYLTGAKLQGREAGRKEWIAERVFGRGHISDVEKAAWPLPNVWLGVSVEDQKTADERTALLKETPAAVRFISYEPALAPVKLSLDCGCGDYKKDHENGIGKCRMPNDLTHGFMRCDFYRGIDWVIVGGESGPGARPFNIQWARDAIAQCKAAGVPCFVKQFGAYITSRNDTGFEGDTPRSWPMDTHTEDETAEVYQGAPVRVRLKDRKGGDISEWPQDLRVREFPA